MYKIEFQDNFFVVTDITTGIEEIREVRNQVKWRLSGSVYSFYYNIANLVDQNSPNIIRLGENAKEFDFSEMVDGSEVPFASRAILNALFNQKLGFILQLTETTWGLITGNIADQTDLQLVLNDKFDVPTGDTTQYIAGDGTLITFPVAGQAGSLVRQVRNVSGATMTKGTVVYINGANGNKPTIAKAKADAESTSARTFGLLQSDIPNNSNGYVVVIGDLVGLDTSAIAEGTQLYLSSTTAGEYTTIKQVAPAHMVYVGKVTRSHPTLGQIEVYVQNGFELDELHDVLITSVADGQVLQFEGASGLWKNKTLATGITIGSTAISSGTDGGVLFQNGGVVQQSSALSFASGTFKLISNGGTQTLLVRNSADTFDIFSTGNSGANVHGFLNINDGANYMQINSGGRWVKMAHDYGQLQFTNSLGNNTFTLGNNGITYFSGNTNIGGGTNGARLDVKAQGALSTDLALRIRNSANTLDIIRANGAGEVFIGLGAGNVNTGANNTFIGISSGLVNTSGANNVGFGLNTLRANTTGQENVAISVNALLSNTTASYNIAIGINSVRTNTTGSANAGIGVNSLYENTTGSNNTAFGHGSSQKNTTGNSNVSFGVNALLSNTTGSNNIAIGQSSGRYIANGSTETTINNNSIFIGYDSKALADNQTNQIVIGHGSIGLGSNTAVIGNSSTTLFRPFGNVAIGADTAGARLDVRAQGALSTDNVFRIRNSANTADLFSVLGNGTTTVQAIVATSSMNISQPAGLYYPTLNFSNNGGAGQGSIFGYNSRLCTTNILVRSGYSLGVGFGEFDAFYAQMQVKAKDALSTSNSFGILDSALSMYFFKVQNNGAIGIGTSTTLSASAKVQIDSTTQGFLPPRMTNAQRTAIASPAVGLMVYCTDAVEGLYVYKSTGWTFVI
jgi:hypothetical protein